MINLDDLIGIPFKNGARGLDHYDCWGLAKEVYRRYGINLPDYPISAMDAVKIGNKFEEEKPNWVEIKQPLQIPCLVVLRLDYGSWANHVGVYICEGKFIHAYSKTGVTITRTEDPSWKHRIIGYYVPRR
jgi:cell wall-associated NlpC family hydrolase